LDSRLIEHIEHAQEVINLKRRKGELSFS